MKRSEINRILADAKAFFLRQNFHLPKWAYWSPEQWAQAGHEADEVRNCGLGWDLTDFGSGDFDKQGLVLFTLRNGLPSGSGPEAKDYCEKAMIIGEQQLTPMHFHWQKMEDIINRAGGRLVLELYNANRNTEELDPHSKVNVSIDGVEQTFCPGEKVVLDPGQSITLPHYMYHTFYAEPHSGRVLAGEVSRVNDDARDNRFLQELPRFPALQEDEPAIHLLCTEYPPAEG
ncbi:MAG: D-lyxose/D-mannose family sugar isomerase [Planctomycetota bacterium]